jgi:hypothetical protein
MSLRPQQINDIPEQTIAVAKAAFPKGNVYMTMRDELGVFYSDEAFAEVFSTRGQPAESPWRLALVTVMQFAENLTDRQAADAVRARIILAVLVTPASIMDNTPMLDLERWTRFRWKLQPHIAVGDTKYGTLANIVGLEQDGIRAFLAVPDPSVRTKLYSQERFQYDAEQDGYTCPQGQFLPLSRFDRLQQAFMYRTSPKVCNACPLKTEYTTSRYGRIVRRSVAQEYLDRVRAYRTTPAYHKALRKRSIWIEPLFGEAKQWHQLVQFRLRRLEKVNIQALLIAAGQNIKRLLSRRERPKPLKPVAAQGLDMPATLVNAVSRCFLSFGSKISCHQPVVLPFPGTSLEQSAMALSTFSTGCFEDVH